MAFVGVICVLKQACYTRLRQGCVKSHCEVDHGLPSRHVVVCSETSRWFCAIFCGCPLEAGFGVDNGLHDNFSLFKRVVNPC